MAVCPSLRLIGVTGLLVAACGLVAAWGEPDSPASENRAGASPLSSSALIYPSADLQERRAALDRFWTDWKRVYLRQGCGGAYVDIAGDGRPTYGDSAANTLTVSEAHGYGMLALVRMSDRDPGAKPLFDEMLAYFLLHPAGSGSGLMAWNQTRDCQDASEGEMTASDGDLDIALALHLAQERWGGYAAEAVEVRAAILEREVSAHDLIRLGDWATDGVYANASRSSDFMPYAFRVFASAADEDADRWEALRDTGYAAWGGVSDVYALETGLVPDFMTGWPDHPRPAPPGFLEGAYDGFYSWNALRYPYRLAADYRTSGDARAARRLSRINTWIRSATGDDPARIASTYRLDGSIPADGRWLGEVGWVSMFASGAIAGSVDGTGDQAWMDALWTMMVETPVEEGDYFGNTLKLLAMIELANL